MDNEGSSEAGHETVSEQIETSVVSLESDDMIIVQPVDQNQATNDDSGPNANDVPIIIDLNNSQIVSGNETTENNTPSRTKKRKRSIKDSPMKPIPPLNDDDDDGSTCSICLDTWESRGVHRLVALKCGHLFGDSCIKRWLHECPGQSKSCPTCKNKAAVRDLRPLFAKRVLMVDKSEEYRLQELLDTEKTKNVELQSTLSAIKLEMAVQKEECSKLRDEYEKFRKHSLIHEMSSQSSTQREMMYKMSMHKNIEINREGGCRALTFGKRIQTLILSQKSTVTLFPGYGVRFVSAYNLQPTVYFRMSPKAIRDLSLDSDEELLAAAAHDVNAYIYSVTNNTPVATITPSTASIWATAFDKTRSRYLHLGSQQGITYIYDVRNCMTHVEQLTTPGDCSPVIGIESMPVCEGFPFGGFIVCTLQSLWFYEYTGSERIIQTKLTIEGPFVSINFDDQTNVLLIATRSKHNPKQRARLIVTKLTKIDDTTVLRTMCTIQGSEKNPIMARSTQITMGDDSLVASYLQDTKILNTWNANTGARMLGFNVDDCILDMVPMYLNNGTLLATLSESKCRIFQLNSV